MGVLDGIRIVEIAGIGPGPFCGMLLADMGAEVILVERAGAKGGDLLDLGKHPLTERQPGIDPGARLANHPGAQHQPVRDDLRLARVLADQRQKILGKTHGSSPGQEAQSSNGPKSKIPAGQKTA